MQMQTVNGSSSYAAKMKLSEHTRKATTQTAAGIGIKQK